MQAIVPGVIHPIIQAPMAGTATPALAAAVCNAGGLGSLGIGGSSIADAARMIAATRELTGRPFNVNVFCHQPARRDAAREAAWLAWLAPLFAEFGAEPPATLAEVYPTFTGNDAATAMLLELRPAVVSLHFGLPAAGQLAALRAAGISIFATATSVAEAQALTAAGVNAIVAQGYEAGGHRGIFDPDGDDERLTTFALIGKLLDAGSPPVIAAGGLMDGRDIRRALEAGAAAAQLGTAFVGCPESAAGAGYRKALANAGRDATTMTSAISGRPARGLINRLVRHGAAAGAPPPADYSLTYDVTKKLFALAAARQADGFGAWWAGAAAHRARALPAAELMQMLLAEMEA
ncbi:NAD(P)H-dependent flavin oxidoreductase [Camelimonas sp. ID_303_24]